MKQLELPKINTRIINLNQQQLKDLFSLYLQYRTNLRENRFCCYSFIEPKSRRSLMQRGLILFKEEDDYGELHGYRICQITKKGLDTIEELSPPQKIRLALPITEFSSCEYEEAKNVIQKSLKELKPESRECWINRIKECVTLQGE